MVPLSVLDLAPIVEGGDVAQALHRSRDLAQHAERWGYRRFWLAEHHGMPGIASAATSVVIGYVAEATRTIRVGAGGIMLPNHAPLVIAEQFGTLAALYPGRIDLGLGRAPGTDQTTAQALRRTLVGGEDRFPHDVVELLTYLGPPVEGRRPRAVPGEDSRVPVWILGSSLFGAQLAGGLGLPFAFASHFAPALLDDALALYRARFQPSAYLAAPYAMIGVNVIAAGTDDEAQWLATSLVQAFVNLRRGMPGRLPAPRDLDGLLSPEELAGMRQTLACSAIGAPATVRASLEAIVRRTRADELMLTAHIHDHAARLRSYEIAAQVRDEAVQGFSQ